MPKGKRSETQGDLQLSRPPDATRTLEVRCGNCQAQFVAWYGSEEDADTEVKDVEKCGLCGGDPFKRDNFKDAVLRLIPYVTARNVKRT